MSVRLYDVFSRDWSYSLDDTTFYPMQFTERDASLILQAVQYLLQQPAYIETMTQAEWDELNGRIAGIIEELSKT